MALLFNPFNHPHANVSSPYSTNITTAQVITPMYKLVDYDNYDTGLNTSYIAQKEMTEYLLYRILDKWLYTDEMCHLLKYLKINNGKVEYISNENEYISNKICNDSVDNIEKKSDFIQENILNLKEMRKLLQRIIEELNYKWYELPHKENLVVDVVERFLKKSLKEHIGSK